jgi:hypothetical protein
MAGVASTEPGSKLLVSSACSGEPDPAGILRW